MNPFTVYGLQLTDLIVIALMIAVAAVDCKKRIIPDSLVLGVALTALLDLILKPEKTWLALLWGGIAGFGALALPALLYRMAKKRDGLGMGDLKFAAALGLWLSWLDILVTLWLASLAGAAVGLIGLRLGKLHRHSKLPFGLFISAAAIIWLIITTNFTLDAVSLIVY